MSFGGSSNDYAAMQAQAQAQAQAKAEAEAREKKRKQNQESLSRSRNYGLDSRTISDTLLTRGRRIAGDTTLSSGSLLSLEGTLG